MQSNADREQELKEADLEEKNWSDAKIAGSEDRRNPEIWQERGEGQKWRKHHWAHQGFLMVMRHGVQRKSLE